jgi:hypothetical protein
MTLQSGFCAPKKQADGTYVISLPVSPDLTMAVLDASIDFGLYVQALIEDPRAGSELLTGSLTSVNQMAAGLSKGTCRRLFPPQCCSSGPRICGICRLTESHLLPLPPLEASGKTVACRQVSKDEFLEGFSDFGPAAEMLYNMYMALTEIGGKCGWNAALDRHTMTEPFLIMSIHPDSVHGSTEIVENQRRAGINPRTFDEIVQSWAGPLLSD